MQLKLSEELSSKKIKAPIMSIPNSLSPKNIFAHEIDNYINRDNYDNSALTEMWNQQHPLINTWLILSSVSICFLSALLFVIH